MAGGAARPARPPGAACTGSAWVSNEGPRRAEARLAQSVHPSNNDDAAGCPSGAWTATPTPCAAWATRWPAAASPSRRCPWTPTRRACRRTPRTPACVAACRRCCCRTQARAAAQVRSVRPSCDTPPSLALLFSRLLTSVSACRRAPALEQRQRPARSRARPVQLLPGGRATRGRPDGQHRPRRRRRRRPQARRPRAALAAPGARAAAHARPRHGQSRRARAVPPSFLTSRPI